MSTDQTATERFNCTGRDRVPGPSAHDGGSGGVEASGEAQDRLPLGPRAVHPVDQTRLADPLRPEQHRDLGQEEGDRRPDHPAPGARHPLKPMARTRRPNPSAASGSSPPRGLAAKSPSQALRFDPMRAIMLATFPSRADPRPAPRPISTPARLKIPKKQARNLCQIYANRPRKRVSVHVGQCTPLQTDSSSRNREKRRVSSGNPKQAQ